MVYSSALEMRRAARHREFESHPLRQILEKYTPEPNIPKVEQAEIPQEISAEQKATHEIDRVENDFISKYQPKFLAKGGEHLVYEVPEHPDIVVKISTEPLKKVINWSLEHGRPLDPLPAEIEALAREHLKKEAARYQVLKNYFGAAHVPNQKEFLVKIPITQEILNAIYDGNPPATTKEAWSVVMVQGRVEALKNPKRLSLVAGYAEHENVPEDAYNQATGHLVLDKNPEEKLEREAFLQVQPHNDLKVLLEKSEEDENLRECLKELVGNIISYTEDTGEILDLAGQDNIVLSQKDGVWTYSLVDARYPGEGNMVKQAKIALLKLSIKSNIDEPEKNVLLNIFNFIRTVNGLAEQLGIPRRINIVPEGAPPDAAIFLKAIR